MCKHKLFFNAKWRQLCLLSLKCLLQPAWFGKENWGIFSVGYSLIPTFSERAYKRSAVCTLFASFAPIMAAFCNGHYRYKSSAKSVVVCFQK